MKNRSMWQQRIAKQNRNLKAFAEQRDKKFEEFKDAFEALIIATSALDFFICAHGDEILSNEGVKENGQS